MEEHHMADDAKTDEVITEPVQEGDQPADKTFTQADLDRIVQDRVARERKKYADYDDLLAKASQLDEIEQAKLSEIERAQQERDAALARATELETDMFASRLHSSILAEASKADRGLVDPAAAIEFLTGSDVELLEFDEQGSPTNMADAMDKLLTKRPYLAGQRSTPSADQGARGGDQPGQVTEAELAQMSPREIVKARAEGRLASLLRG